MKLHDRVEIVFWQHTAACSKEFKLWNQKEKLLFHVGGVNSAHNQAIKKSEDISKENQYIQSILVKQLNQDKIEYWVQLNAIVDCIWFLLCRVSFVRIYALKSHLLACYE